MPVELDQACRRGIDEAVIGADQHRRVAAGEGIEEQAERGVQRGEARRHRVRGDAVGVGVGVDFRVVGMEELRRAATARQGGQGEEHAFRRGVSDAGRAASVKNVKGRMNDGGRRYRPGRPAEAVEEIAMGEQAVGLEPQGSDAGRARLERQRCDDPVHLAEIQMPAGQGVLLRRQSGKEGGDRAGGGGGKDRGETPDPMAMQYAARAAPHEVVVAQTVDHQEDKIAGGAQRFHVESSQWRIGQGRGATGVGHAAHQVDDAPAAVVRQCESGGVGRGIIHAVHA